jgi:predicted Rossmann fold nucleotide-binding protein DprA/Smf involved in DNA uptake
MNVIANTTHRMGDALGEGGEGLTKSTAWQRVRLLPDRSPDSQPILALGDQTCLTRPTMALLSSANAPASILLAVHDLAQGWRRQGPVIMSGFQSPVENEALAVLLRGPQPLVIWLGRGPLQRLPTDYEQPLAQERLLLIAPFGAHVKRATTESALIRNRLLAQAADALLVAHAEPGGKTEQLAVEMIATGRTVYTLDHPTNARLFALGARLLG